MTITILSDVIMPESVVSAGVRGRQVRQNERTQSLNGTMRVNVQWDQTLREFQVGFVAMPLESWSALEALFEVTDAGAFGFLMFDPKDYRVSQAQGLLSAYNSGFPVGSIGFGYGEPEYFLFKRTTSVGSTRTKDRPITRPAGAVVYRGGVAVVAGTAPGQVSIDADTGSVVFVPDSFQSITSITVGADTVLVFSTGTGVVADFEVGDRVYLLGVSGTAADVLNNQSHLITAKDAGAFTLTIETPTTGLTATSGTARKYPQAGETLAWAGLFYIAVHFVNDELEWDLVTAGDEAGRLVAGPTATLMQILESPG